MTSGPTAGPIARFFGAALMAIGGLIAVLSGLCSLGFLGFMVFGTLSNATANVSARAIVTMLLGLVTLIGFDALPIGFGVAMFLWGRSIRRGPAWRAPNR